MTDKELIKQEIERQKSFYQKTFDVLHPDDLDATIAYAHIELLDRLIQFIDSLPEESTNEANCTAKSDDLEEASRNYADNEEYGDDVYYAIKAAFKAGAEWQKQKDQETIELAEDHAMLAGMNKMKEEMMKDAVDAIVSQVPCSNEIIFHNPASVQWFYLPSEMNKLGVEKGDKVKIIIVKED